MTRLAGGRKAAAAQAASAAAAPPANAQVKGPLLGPAAIKPQALDPNRPATAPGVKVRSMALSIRRQQLDGPSMCVLQCDISHSTHNRTWNHLAHVASWGPGALQGSGSHAGANGNTGTSQARAGTSHCRTEHKAAAGSTSAAGPVKVQASSKKPQDEMTKVRVIPSA